MNLSLLESAPVAQVRATEGRRDPLGVRLAAWIEGRAGCRLAGFQRRFLRGAFKRGILKAALTGPRGLSKSSMSGWLLGATLDPAAPLYRPNGESVLLAGSVEQARACFSFMRQVCTGPEYRWIDTAQRLGVVHRRARTRVRVISSDAKRAFGLVGARLVVGDEPASWQARGGKLMYDALETTGGKSEMTLILIGTRAPAEPPHWWLDLLDLGSTPGVYVQRHEAVRDDSGEVADWDTWPVIRAAHPMVGVNPNLKPKIAQELRDARLSDDNRARFISYRLNLPIRPAAEVLFTVPQWKRIEHRPLGPRSGRPIVGLDIGSTRSWSAAVVLWESLRCEIVMSVPGVPNLAAREKADGVPVGTYQALVDDGVLHVDEGRRVARVDALMDRVMKHDPILVVADRYRIAEVSDAVAGRCPVMGRVTRWQESTDDLQRCRQVGLDEGLSVDPAAVQSFRVALAESAVESDGSGNFRLAKGRGDRSRQDLLQALVLACGRVPRRNADRGPGYAVA